MASRIKAGYYDTGVAQFKNGQWFINSTPVSQQIKLDQYPCYSLEGSDLGSYVCVIGDTNYNYSNTVIMAASGMNYSYQEDNPDLLSAIWLLEYTDAFYLAVKGIFQEREVISVIPVAFNAYDMELYLKELHLYIDIEETTVLGTIVLFDTSVQSTHVHFYLNRADCENVCSLCVNTVLSKGILTSLTPNITGFDANMNTEYVEEMGVVDIHLVGQKPSEAEIQQACAKACDGFMSQGKRVSPSGYLPQFNASPCTAQPAIIPSNVQNWASLMTVTSPDDESLALEISDFIETIEGDYDDEEYEQLIYRYHLLIAVIVASQVCGFTAQDYTISHFKEWLTDASKVSVLRDCLMQDFLFPDAIAFYSESGLLLHGEDYANIEAIISGEYAVAIYDKIAEACGSSFSLEYARMMQTRKSCFKEGKSNRATLPGKVPFAEWGFGRDIALLYYAYTGILEHTYVPAVNKYVLWDLLCTGPYLNATLMSCWSRVSSRSEPRDCARLNFVRGDVYMDEVMKAQGKKTIFNYSNYEGIRLSGSDLTKLAVFETTYKYTAVNSADRVPKEVGHTTLAQWFLLSCNMVALSDAIPRGLCDTSVSMNNLTVRAICYLLQLWLRTILGTIEEGRDSVCKYTPFMELSWKQLSNEWMLQGLSAQLQWLPYGWQSYAGVSHNSSNRFVVNDARGRDRVLRGYASLSNYQDEDPYKYVKANLRQVLMKANHGESQYGNYYTNLGLFNVSDATFIPACYEFDENDKLKSWDDNDDALYEALESGLIPHTVGTVEYVQRTVNALLALSDKAQEGSFFNQYMTALRLVNKFFMPIFSLEDEVQMRYKLILTVCYIQTIIPEYTLDNLITVLNDLNVDTAWSLMLKRLPPNIGASGVLEACRPKEQPAITSSTKLNEDLESLLKSLETINLDETEPVLIQEYVHPALKLLTRDSSGLFELLPRSELAQKAADFKNDIVDKPEELSGLAALEQELGEESSFDNLLDDLGSFLEAGGGLASLEESVSSEAEPDDVVTELESPETQVQSSSIPSGLAELLDTPSDLDDDTQPTQVGIVNGLASLENDFESLNNADLLSDNEKRMLDVLGDGENSEESKSTESEVQDNIEYLYNSAAPDSTAILIQQISTGHPMLAFKLLAVIPIAEEMESILIEPNIQAITALCDNRKGYCYFDAEDALRVNIDGVECYVLQVNNAERRVKNALSNGMLTYKYYGAVLPKIFGSSILT